VSDTHHTEQIITQALIERAAELGACADGLEAAQALIGRPIADLPSNCISWAARLFNGRSILSDGAQVWYRDGTLHREDGPAYISRYGTQIWYRDGELHREDGPAIIVSWGGEEWWLNGRLHRDDGPAVTYPPRRREWWRDGERQPEPA
jgi:hypothetical protein